jgi:hypothetical protein
MAKFITKDYSVLLDDVDFSSSIAAVTLEETVETQETTSFGAAGGARTRISGLKDSTLSIDFHQDFGASSIDSTFHDLLGEEISFEIKPTSGAIAADNPAYSGNLIVTTYSPFANAIGELATLSVTWEVTGPITRTTTPA